MTSLGKAIPVTHWFSNGKKKTNGKIKLLVGIPIKKPMFFFWKNLENPVSQKEGGGLAMLSKKS